MSVCSICGEHLPPDRKVCDVCGTSVPSNPTSPPNRPAEGSAPPAPVPPLPLEKPRSTSRPSGNRVCSLCQTVYGPDHDDEFCRCGGELLAAPELSVEPNPTGSPRPDALSGHPESNVDRRAFEGGSGAVTVSPGPLRPPVGTDCLVVYSEQKTPIHYCPIDKDVTVIGRSDPVRGDFPDLDLGELFDPTTARKISRKHALVLRLRDSHSYLIRPLGGNTGTQIEREMAEPLRDYPLTIGTRMVLGGAVRLKFEKMA